MFSVNNIFNGSAGNSIELNGKSNRAAAQRGNQFLHGIFEKDNGINGLIDENVFQGNKGDCWLISGVLSMSYTEDGAKLIKDAISQNADGSYNVFFKGINKSYKVSQKELDSKNTKVLDDAKNKNSKYSTGDDDMLLMELALEKLVDDKSIPIQTIEGITGGSAYYLYQLLSDNQVTYVYGGDNQNGMNTLLDYYETFQDSCSATIGVIDGFDGLEDDHAYAVKSINKNDITLINPWDSTKDIKISMADMVRNAKNYDMSLLDYDLPEETDYFSEYYT